MKTHMARLNIGKSNSDQIVLINMIVRGGALHHLAQKCIYFEFAHARESTPA